MARKRAITAACGPRGARANLTKGRLGFPLQIDATRAITVERLVANQNLSELIAWANFLKPTLQASFEGDGEGPPENVDFLAEVIIHALPSAWRDHVAAIGTDDAFPSPKCSGCHEFQPSSLPETCTCGEEFAFSIEEREEDLVCEGCNTPATFAGQRFCMKCKDVKAMVSVSNLKGNAWLCCAKSWASDDVRCGLCGKARAAGTHKLPAQTPKIPSAVGLPKSPLDLDDDTRKAFMIQHNLIIDQRNADSARAKEKDTENQRTAAEMEGAVRFSNLSGLDQTLIECAVKGRITTLDQFIAPLCNAGSVVEKAKRARAVALAARSAHLANVQTKTRAEVDSVTFAPITSESDFLQALNNRVELFDHFFGPDGALKKFASESTAKAPDIARQDRATVLAMMAHHRARGHTLNVSEAVAEFDLTVMASVSRDVPCPAVFNCKLDGFKDNRGRALWQTTPVAPATSPFVSPTPRAPKTGAKTGAKEQEPLGFYAMCKEKGACPKFNSADKSSGVPGAHRCKQSAPHNGRGHVCRFCGDAHPSFECPTPNSG